MIRLEQSDMNNFQKLNFNNDSYTNDIINPNSDFVLQQTPLDDSLKTYETDKFSKNGSYAFIYTLNCLTRNFCKNDIRQIFRSKYA